MAYKLKTIEEIKEEILNGIKELYDIDNTYLTKFS